MGMKKGWHRHFVYRKETLKTTWKLRLLVLIVVLGTLTFTRGFWTARIAQSLVCAEKAPHSDALLLENFDPDYLVFERAETLYREGIAPRVLVPAASVIEEGMAELLARFARLSTFEIIPVGEVQEPISLNSGKHIRDFLKKKHIKSVVVVSPGFRSGRSALVYGTVLAPEGITVGCVPVWGATTASNWTKTWHGIQGVAEQFAKLQYYRFWVLR